MVQGVPYRVEWLDAHNLDAGWEDVTPEAEFPDAIINTVGFFLAITKTQLVLAADWCEDDKITNTRVAIPLGCVTKVWRLTNG